MHRFSLIFGFELCESLRDVCRKNCDFWKVRFYNCSICDLNCTIFVLCGRILSYLKHSLSPTPVTSGVPQGSIHGPLLFLLYANDLPPSMVSSSIATYADDTKLFKEINCPDEATALQDDLLNFETISSNAGHQLNPSKCKALRVTSRRKTIEHPYSLENQTLQTSKRERDLGERISNNLTWRKQVLKQRSKANKLLGFVSVVPSTKSRWISSRLCNASLVATVRRAHLPIRTSTKAYFKIHPWPAFSLRSQLRAMAEEIEAFPISF
jgi:hypothetical protein